MNWTKNPKISPVIYISHVSNFCKKSGCFLFLFNSSGMRWHANEKKCLFFFFPYLYFYFFFFWKKFVFLCHDWIGNLRESINRYIDVHVVYTIGCRELYLDGNNLECKGLVNLISLCAEQAFYESTMRAEEAAKKLQEEAEKAERGT